MMDKKEFEKLFPCLSKEEIRGLETQEKFEAEYGKVMKDKFNEVFAIFLLLPLNLREALVGTLFTYMLLGIKDKGEQEKCLLDFMNQTRDTIKLKEKEDVDDNLDEIFGKGGEG